MSNENWSPWIQWHGGECPLPDDVTTKVRLRSDHPEKERLGFSERWNWEHNRLGSDIIAYRYLIQENEMHPDLEWLARNVTEWHSFSLYACVERNYPDSEPSLFWSDFVEDNHKVTQWAAPSWLQARKDLGLIMSDAEEEIPAPEWAGVPEGAEVHDNVNKPKHYQLREGYEVYDLRQDLAAKAANGGATYDQYSDWDRAIEYIIRMWGKNRLEDAKKGRWYLDKLIGKLEANE